MQFRCSIFSAEHDHPLLSSFATGKEGNLCFFVQGMNYGQPKIESSWLLWLELGTQWKTFTCLDPCWGFGRAPKVHQQVVWDNTTFIAYLYAWGGARGGLGGYIPRRSMLAPPSEGETRFLSEIFGIYSTLKTIF